MVPPRTIAVRDIIDATDVRKLAGNVTRKTMMAWRAKDFPQPIRTTGRGIELWDRRDVRAWLRARGDLL